MASEIKDIMLVPVFISRAMRISIMSRKQLGIARPPGVAKRFCSRELLGGLARAPNQVHSITEKRRHALNSQDVIAIDDGQATHQGSTNLRSPRNKSKTTAGALRNEGHGLRFLEHTVSRTRL